MKKYSWYLIVFTFLTLAAHAQEKSFALINTKQPLNVLSGAFPAYDVLDTKVDSDGNTYAVGYFRGTVDFDPTPGFINLVSTVATIYDGFIAKYDPYGNLIFAKAIQGNFDKRINGIALTSTGKLLVTGYFLSSANFDPGVSDYTLVSTGGSDGFLAQFDATTGAFENALNVGNTGNDGIMKILVDDADNVYLYGYFVDYIDADFGVGVTDLFATSPQDRFIALYTPSLDLQWGYAIPYFITSLALDDTGYSAAGNFTGTHDFDPGAGELLKTSAGSNDAWITKFDTDGSVLWNHTIGGAGFENIYKIAVSSTDDIYATGVFNQAVDFDPSAGTTTLTSNGQNDVFVTRFNAAGDFNWAVSWGGTQFDYGYSIAMLEGDKVVVSGAYFSPAMDIDPGAGTITITNSGAPSYSNAYLMLLNDDGSLLDHYTYGLPGYNESALSVAANGLRFAVSGIFNQPVDFDPTAAVVSLPNATTFQNIYLNTYSLLAPTPAAQPTALVLSNETSSSIDVSFTGSGADGYLVLRRPGVTSTSLPTDGFPAQTGGFLKDAQVAYFGSGTSFTDMGLAANTAYHYTVYALNGAGTGTNYLLPDSLTGSTSTLVLTADLASDSLALVAIYNATNGAAWTNNTNWLTGPINTWQGITITSNRVSSFILGSNNITGNLPPVIGNLTALTNLQLWGNQITGNIPPELGQITSLTYLDLSPNLFTGVIPPELGNLTQLTTLWVNNNLLTGTIPPELGNLTSLSELYLMGNQLTGNIPPDLGNLSSLTVLDASGNQLSGTIPPELGSLSLLEQLKLNGNQLTGNIPIELTTLTALTSLTVDQNKLSGNILPELGDIVTLQNLRLNSNQFTGSIPTELGNLTSLIYLDVGGNQLTGSIPASIFSNSLLQTFGAAGNQLSGPIPTEITNAIGLTNVWLDRNQLSGTFPSITSSTNPNIDQLVLNENNLEDLPDLTTLNGLVSYVNFANNNLTFEDLEANIAGLSFTYSPQKNIGVADTVILNAGDPFNLSYPVGGTANSYIWKLNTVNDSTYQTNTLNIPSVVPANTGNWTLMVVNSLAPDLTLLSNIVRIEVKAEVLFTWADGGDLTTQGANANIYGGTWGDYDNDGFEDLFTIGVNDSISGGLYHNNGEGTFTRTSLIDFSDGRSGQWGDYNNDGFLDLFVPDGTFSVAATDGTSSIFKNNGNGTFTKIDLTQVASTVSGTWADMDRDGDLDISLGTTGIDDLFLRNDGGDVFTVWDFNINDNTQWNNVLFHADDDSEIDVLLPSPNSNTNTVRLFMNEVDDCTDCDDFYESYTFPPVFNGPRSASVADIDNDGDFDIYVMNSATLENRFFINSGDGYFTEELVSIRVGEIIRGGRGAAFGDMNNDGYVDLITYQNTIAPAGWFVYLNNGDGTFTREANQTFKRADGLEGISLADYDNDGFLDAISSTYNGGVTNGLYKNAGNGNHWIKLKLTGSSSNRAGIGARIAVKADGFWQYHQVLTSNGFANQNSLLTHAGLGSVTQADSIIVDWPSGYRQVLLNQAADQLLTIVEPQNPVSGTDLELIASYQIKVADNESFVTIEDVTSVTIDANDNTIISGFFEGTVDFDVTGAENLVTAQSDEESYLAKYSSTGALIWLHTFGSPDEENRVGMEAVTVDTDNSVLVAADVSGEYDVDKGAGTALFTSTNADSDPIFIKYASDGTYVLAGQLEYTPSSFGYADLEEITTDELNNIIVAGDFYDGALDVDPSGTVENLTSTDTYSDVFLAKYDENGVYQWAVKIGQDNQYESTSNIITDSQENIYIAYFLDTEGGGSFIEKYSPAGALIWTVEAESMSEAYLKIDEANNRIYMFGGYEGLATFTGTSGSGTLPAIPLSDDVACYAIFDLNGGFTQAVAFPSSSESFILSMNLLEDGNLLVAGAFEGTIDMDPGAGTFEQYYSGATLLTKLTPSGGFIWGASLPGSYGAVTFVNNQNELVAVMPYDRAVDIDPGSGVTTISSASREEIAILRYRVQAGILAADSLALLDFYTATGGPNWTNRTNWLSGNINNWFGVVVSNNQITAINLPNNNLTGTVPSGSLVLNELSTLNLSGNNITAVPDFSPLTGATSVNISNNKLDFSSLEYNVDVPGIVLNNQKEIPIGPDSVLVTTGDDHLLQATIGGTANSYLWKRNTTSVGVTTDDILIENIGRGNMGSYVLEITNSIVPGVTLQTRPVNVLATATLSGKLMMSPTTPATDGTVRLLRVTSADGYDTLKTHAVNIDGAYTFSNVVLDDYQIVGLADTLVAGQERALPTYYQSTIYWEEADTLFVEGSLTDLDIISQLEPEDEPTGTGVIAGIVEEDDGTGGRGQVTKRVGGAGVSARRTQGTGKGKEILELIAYVYTNENGEFTMDGLPEGDYRINIQYPGYPMDEESDIDITIGSSPLEEVVTVEATVAEGKISVKKLIVTGIEGNEYIANVHPNPASESIYVSFKDQSSGRTVELLDTRGMKIESKPAPGVQVQLDVHSLQPGLYLMKVKEKGNAVKTVRVSVQE